MNAAVIGPLCAFASCFTWALGTSLYSRLARDHSAFSVNFTRATFALPLFAIGCLVSAGGFHEGLTLLMQVDAPRLAWFALSILASYGLGDACFMWSTRSLGVPGALAIASIYPVWTALSGAFFQDELLTALQLIGLVLAVAGVVTVISNPPVRAGAVVDPSRSKLVGVLLALITSFFWCLNSFATSRAGREIDPITANVVRMTIALVLCALFGKFFAPKSRLVVPWSAIGASWWIFVIEAFGGSVLFIYGLSRSSLAVGSTLSSLAPVVSVPIALLWRVERFSWKRTLGVLTAVLGVCLLTGSR